MIREPLSSLVQRADTIDVLADNLKPLIDAAAKCGLEELFTINQILNRRGVKIGVLEDYGLLRRKRYEFEERASQREAKKVLEREQAKISPVVRDRLAKEAEIIRQAMEIAIEQRGTDNQPRDIEDLECLK